MTLPSNTNQQIQIFQIDDKNFERKQSLIQNPDVIKKLSQTELMLASASVATVPVRHMEHEVIMQKIAPLIKGICRDVGIKSWSNTDPEFWKYHAARFKNVLQKYYRDFTLNEVGLAFEFMMVGELDDFLPKDKFGSPDKNHFQDFSFEYYSRVLNAFKRRRAEIWFKASQAVPKIEMTIPEQTRKDNENGIVQEIWNAFESYQKNKVDPEFIEHVFIRKFIESGLIDGLPKPTKKSIDSAFRRIKTDRNVTKQEKDKMTDEYEKHKMTYILKCEAQRIQNNIRIKLCFDELIAAEKNIQDVMEKSN